MNSNNSHHAHIAIALNAFWKNKDAISYLWTYFLMHHLNKSLLTVKVKNCSLEAFFYDDMTWILKQTDFIILNLRFLILILSAKQQTSTGWYSVGKWSWYNNEWVNCQDLP